MVSENFTKMIEDVTVHWLVEILPRYIKSNPSRFTDICRTPFYGIDDFGCPICQLHTRSYAYVEYEKYGEGQPTPHPFVIEHNTEIEYSVTFCRIEYFSSPVKSIL